MSEYDPTFVRVLTYICPVPYQTYVCPYFIKTKSRFTKQVCPAPCQIGRRQQFGPEHCRIQNTVPTWRHSVRPDTIRSESSVYNHQLTQPLQATHHIRRTEFLVNITNECLLFPYQSTILRNMVPRDYQYSLLSCFAVEVLGCGWTRGCASFGCHVTLL